MTFDFRETAISAIDELMRLADRFPPHSAGSRAIKKAAWKLKREYVLSTAHKGRLVLTQLSRGLDRIEPLVISTGLFRADVVEALTFLIDKGFVNEVNGTSPGGKGGRPYRRFELTAEGFQKSFSKPI